STSSDLCLLVSVRWFSITFYFLFFFSSRRRHTRSKRDWSSDVCSSDLELLVVAEHGLDDVGGVPDLHPEALMLHRIPGGFAQARPGGEQAVVRPMGVDQTVQLRHHLGAEIGRASGRERGSSAERGVCVR